jgi:glycosyltransferase involved in cell wall biosynthesis
VSSDDILILQPTHIVQHKGIEHAVQLVEELKDPRCKLVISHAEQEEGNEYAGWLQESARHRNVDLRILSMQPAFPKTAADNAARLLLRDIFPHVDFITYPSLFEGFGSAFLDAVYFRKPLLINRYANFVVDIEPRGFDLIVMDGYLTRKTVEAVRQVLNSAERRERMVQTNYEIGARHYSFDVLERCAGALLAKFFGR